MIDPRYGHLDTIAYRNRYNGPPQKCDCCGQDREADEFVTDPPSMFYDCATVCEDCVTEHVACEWCEKRIERDAVWAEHNKHPFCSERCESDWITADIEPVGTLGDRVDAAYDRSF